MIYVQGNKVYRETGEVRPFTEGEWIIGPEGHPTLVGSEDPTQINGVILEEIPNAINAEQKTWSEMDEDMQKELWKCDKVYYLWEGKWREGLGSSPTQSLRYIGWNTPSEAKKYECMECKKPCLGWADDYMVHDALWLSVMPSKKGLLCLQCFEKKLGRAVSTQDLPNMPANDKLKTALRTQRAMESITTASVRLSGRDVIPPITHPLGANLDQPDRADITFEDGVAYMTQETHDKLSHREWGFPTGVYAGKMWRCKDRLVWFEDVKEEDACVNTSAHIEITPNLPEPSSMEDRHKKPNICRACGEVPKVYEKEGEWGVACSCKHAITNPTRERLGRAIETWDKSNIHYQVTVITSEGNADGYSVNNDEEDIQIQEGAVGIQTFQRQTVIYPLHAIQKIIVERGEP